MQDRAIVTIEGEYETALKLSNGTSVTSNLDFKVTILFNVKQVYRDDTKAAARQSPNCIKKTKKYGENDFQYDGWNSYTLQCGMIMTLISPGDCNLQCGMRLWDHDSEFTKWQ